METDTSEREQIDELRKWWNANGKSMLSGLLIGLVILFGYRYWQSVIESKAESASINYQHFLERAAAGPSDEVRSIGKAVIEGYPDSAYARLTALLLARIEVEDKKPAEAKKQLHWIIDNGRDSELVSVARGRLAQILLSEGNAEGAWDEISKNATASKTEMFAELKGDVLSALGKRAEARSMYSQAITAVGAVGGDPGYLELKRDALGADVTTVQTK